MRLSLRAERFSPYLCLAKEEVIEMKWILVLCSVFLTTHLAIGQAVRATTEDGKVVLLNSDGSWAYEKNEGSDLTSPVQFIQAKIERLGTDYSREDKPGMNSVVLLHGLARSSESMQKMQFTLEEAGFKTCNIEYPSTKYRIETLALEHILPEVKACVGTLESPIDFVAHSLGGILVRYMAEHALIPRMGRVVMLSPPNHGSEVVDKLGDTWLFEYVNGPAGRELGTDSTSMPLQLGPADFELGIITGSRSTNPILSYMIEGTDDGKVSIEHAKLEGMKDFAVVPVGHSLIMKNETAIEQAIYFLKTGVFRESGS